MPYLTSEYFLFRITVFDFLSHTPYTVLYYLLFQITTMMIWKANTLISELMALRSLQKPEDFQSPMALNTSGTK